MIRRLVDWVCWAVGLLLTPFTTPGRHRAGDYLSTWEQTAPDHDRAVAVHLACTTPTAEWPTVASTVLGVRAPDDLSSLTLSGIYVLEAT